MEMQNHKALQKACEDSMRRLQQQQGVTNVKVAEIVACALVDFISKEAGTIPPAFWVDQVCSIMQVRIGNIGAPGPHPVLDRISEN
jgi:hypothetical protein